MRTRILQFAAVLGMGVLALTVKPQPLAAEKACGGGMVICTSACPPHPDLMCRSYNCAGAGASCTAASCGGMDYTVHCDAAA